MNRPAVLALAAALILLLAIGVGAWLLAPGAGGASGRSSTGERSEGARSEDARSEGSSNVGTSGDAQASGATSGSGDAGEVVDVALGEASENGTGGRGDGGAALGLPPVDTGPVDDLCEALEASQRRLGTSRSMMEKMPEKSRGSVGAKKLRIVHDRLEKEVERYERRAKARGECGV